MDRAEGTALVVAVLAHAALLAVLSAMFLHPEKLPVPRSDPIEISLSDDIGLESRAPEINPEPPKTQLAPVEGPVEPEEAPPEPEPEPRPVPKKEPAPAPKPDPNAAKAKTPPPSSSKAANPNARRNPVSPSGRLDDAFEKGLTEQRSPGKSDKSQAKMTGQAAQDIAAAIQRQVQPCADRQVNPGPGSERIRAIVSLSLNRDGSLAEPAKIVGHDGVDDDNSRYVRRVDDAVRAIFAGCSPLRNLPVELYDVPNGWRRFTLRYRLKT